MQSSGDLYMFLVDKGKLEKARDIIRDRYTVDKDGSPDLMLQLHMRSFARENIKEPDITDVDYLLTKLEEHIDKERSRLGRS